MRRPDLDGYEIGPACAEDLPEIVNLANSVFRAGPAGDMGRDYPLLFNPQNSPNLCIARRDGEIVSHVGICPRWISLDGAAIGAALIGSVATAPEHRGRGLAGALMHLAIARARSLGLALMLISGDRGVYKRLGFEEWGRFRRFFLPAAEGSDFDTERVDVASTAALAAAMELHRREPVRFFRPRADWIRLLEVGMIVNGPGDLWLARRGGVPLAAAAVRLSKPHQPAGLWCGELTGDRTDGFRLLGRLAG